MHKVVASNNNNINYNYNRNTISPTLEPSSISNEKDTQSIVRTTIDNIISTRRRNAIDTTASPTSLNHKMEVVVVDPETSQLQKTAAFSRTPTATTATTSSRRNRLQQRQPMGIVIQDVNIDENDTPVTHTNEESISVTSMYQSNILIHEQTVDPKTKLSTVTKVRIASQPDDMDIAYLRMSVFSDMNVQPNDIRTQFCTRSCQAIAARRLRGAVCFVATQQQQEKQIVQVPLLCDSAATATKPPPSSCGDDESADLTSNELIVGSIECSYHEFFHTRLGQCRKQNALLYITEVAVHPSMRRRGIGTKLLQAIDIYAQQLMEHENVQIETLYLHVDVLNYGAIRMYEQSGYYKVLSDDPVYTEFTYGLNLQPGATRGREHYLLCKNLVDQPIWLLQNQDCNDHCILPDNPNPIIHHQQPQQSKQQRYPILGQFGIEIPA